MNELKPCPSGINHAQVRELKNYGSVAVDFFVACDCGWSNRGIGSRTIEEAIVKWNTRPVTTKGEQEGRVGRELLKELLFSKNCYTTFGCEIPEEISARFDVGLILAYRIHDFFSSAPQVRAENESEKDTVKKLREIVNKHRGIIGCEDTCWCWYIDDVVNKLESNLKGYSR
jgi:hypothetical protein